MFYKRFSHQLSTIEFEIKTDFLYEESITLFQVSVTSRKEEKCRDEAESEIV